MLIVLIKSVITFVIVFFFIRLMGKRQLGEMQPLELVITLIIAEVACIPMNDPYIPFYSGVIPIVTLAFLHIVFSFVSRKSMTVRKLLSGSSMIAIDKDGINYKNLRKMNINVNDLIEAVRSSGYSDLKDIEYAIFETNGKLCVIEKPSDPTKPTPALLPLALLVDGKWDDDSMTVAGITKPQVTKELNKHKVGDVNDVLYADIRQDGTLYVSPKNAPCFTANVNISGGGNW
ncbi:MAG: DUF421 domain-containing protein [Clostridia bacterium]|nr:DUF421 domain-containing protein [Clostridia bacterium]